MQLDIESGNTPAMMRIRHAGNRKGSGVVFGGVLQLRARGEVLLVRGSGHCCRDRVTESLYRTVGVKVELRPVGGTHR